MIRRTADVQKENGNGILKTRGRLTPVEAMADGPVAAMAVITPPAAHERISKICLLDRLLRVSVWDWV